MGEITKENLLEKLNQALAEFRPQVSDQVTVLKRVDRHYNREAMHQDKQLNQRMSQHRHQRQVVKS